MNADHPNILWICTDQQRYDTIGALGDSHINTPHIDRLVDAGVAFSNAYCQSPICTPSRASFLTGMYPSSVHACLNGNERWAGAAPLVTKLFSDAGYDCGLVGKLHLSGAEGRVEPRPDDGYRVFRWSHHPRDDWKTGHDYADWLRAQGEDLNELQQHPDDIPPALHQTTWCIDEAVKFIEEERSRPWLLSVNPFDPHTPFEPPREYRERYDADALPGPLFRESDLAAQARLTDIDFQTEARWPAEFNAKETIAAYYAMIELIAHNVGRLLAALERTGQRDNTIVVFMSDHGEMLGDHGLLLKGCRFYEGLVRVPLIVSWPAQIEAGLVSDALVELTDIAPTLLDAAGIPIPGHMQGRSLLPILTGQHPPNDHRDHIRAEYYRALNPDTSGGAFAGSYATMIRDERYKLVVYHGHDVGELFDLRDDPGEFYNLWDDPAYAGVRFDLMERSFDALAFAVDMGPEQTRYY